MGRAARGLSVVEANSGRSIVRESYQLSRIDREYWHAETEVPCYSGNPAHDLVDVLWDGRDSASMLKISPVLRSWLLSPFVRGSGTWSSCRKC
jgi:hypothetical protein